MQGVEPPITKNAGDVVFPDIGWSAPIELAGIAALAWVLFAPVLIGVAARRGRLKRAVAVYASGVLVATLYFTALSDMWAGESLVHRLGVWARYIWMPLWGAATILVVVAGGVGRVSRWLSPPKNCR